MAAIPAGPTLASAIYKTSSSDRYREEEEKEEGDEVEKEEEVGGKEGEAHHDRPRKKRKRVNNNVNGRVFVKTGCEGVDKALRDGLVHGDGGVCCISGEENSGVDEIYRSLLISHLLRSSSSAEAAKSTDTATVIDTLGTFDVLKLHQGIVSRLESSRHSPPSHELWPSNHVGMTEQQSHESCVEKAGQILDKVKIMRVFDFEGLIEGIEEMKAELEMFLQRPRLSLQEDKVQEDGEKEEVGERRMLQRVKSTIADSQGDEEDEEVEVDMLDDLPGNVPPPLITNVGTEGFEDKNHDSDKEQERQQNDDREQEQEQRKQHNMLIITNLTSVVAPLIKSNYVQGQALLTNFLRSLAHTARRHNICVLVLNSTLTYRDDAETPSAFSSVVSKPALGKSLGYLVDVHLFVNRIPRAQKDVRAAYAESKTGEGGRMRRRVDWVGVVEVLRDRKGGRAGRVGLFGLDGCGLLSSAV